MMNRAVEDNDESTKEHGENRLPFFFPFPTTPKHPRAEKPVPPTSFHRKSNPNGFSGAEYHRGMEYPTGSTGERWDRSHRHPSGSPYVYEKERRKGQKVYFHSGETGRSSPAAPTFTTVLPASVSLTSSDARWPLYSTTTCTPAQRPADQVLGEYALGETIGRGSFGKVKRGRHIATNELVAIKILDYVKLRAAKMDQRIFSEIKILRLFSHPNICRLYDVIQTPTHIFLIMEYVEGGELFDYIVKEGKVKEVEARYIFQQIICALEYCHHYRVVHRDLKPENILLGPGLQVKLIDFGLSSIMQDGEFLATSCGSANYAAPEVICGKLYCGPEVDVWSCGVILYALINGMLPFDDASSPALFAMIRKGKYVVPPTMPKAVVQLVGQLLCVDPLKRLTIPQVRDNAWFITRLPPRLSYSSSISYTMKTPRIVFPVLCELGRRLHCTWKDLHWQVDKRVGFVHTAYQILVDVDVNKAVANELSSILRIEEEPEEEVDGREMEREKRHEGGRLAFPSLSPWHASKKKKEKKKSRSKRRERVGDSPAQKASLGHPSPQEQTAPRSSRSSHASASNGEDHAQEGLHRGRRQHTKEKGKKGTSSGRRRRRTTTATHVASPALLKGGDGTEWGDPAENETNPPTNTNALEKGPSPLETCPPIVPTEDLGKAGRANSSTIEGGPLTSYADGKGSRKSLSFSSMEIQKGARRATGQPSPSPSPREVDGNEKHCRTLTKAFSPFPLETGVAPMEAMESPSPSPFVCAATTGAPQDENRARNTERREEDDDDDEDDEDIEEEEEEEEEDWLAPYPFPRVAALRELNLGLLLSQSPVMEALLDHYDAAIVKDTYNCCIFVPASFLSEGGVSGGVSRMMSRSSSGMFACTPSISFGKRDDYGYTPESFAFRSHSHGVCPSSHECGETLLPLTSTTATSADGSLPRRAGSSDMTPTSEESGPPQGSAVVDPTAMCHVTVVPKTLESASGVSPLCVGHSPPGGASSAPLKGLTIAVPPLSSPMESMMRRRSKEGEGDKMPKSGGGCPPPSSLSPPLLSGRGERRGSGGHTLFGSFPMSHGSCHPSAYSHPVFGHPISPHGGYPPLSAHYGGRGFDNEHLGLGNALGAEKDRPHRNGYPLTPLDTLSPPPAYPPCNALQGARGMGAVEENRMTVGNSSITPREFLPTTIGVKYTAGEGGGMTTLTPYHSPREATAHLPFEPFTPGSIVAGEGGGPFPLSFDRPGVLGSAGSSLEESIGSGATPLVGSVASSCVAYTAHERQFMVAHNCGWRLGIMSDLSTEKLLKGLYAVLKKSEMQWKVLSPFSILTRTTPITWKVMRGNVSETSRETKETTPMTIASAASPTHDKDTHRDCSIYDSYMTCKDTNNTINTNTNKDSTDNCISNDKSGSLPMPFKEVQIGIQIFRLHEKHSKGFLVDWRVKNSPLLLSGLDIVYHLSNNFMEWGRDMG